MVIKKPDELIFLDDVSEKIALRQYESALTSLLTGVKKLACSSLRVSEKQFEYYFERSAAVYLLKNEFGAIKFDDKPACNFCGKSAEAVEKLIGGPMAFICSECVTICNGIIIETSRSEDET